MKYASYGTRKAMARDMRPIYTAPTVQAAELAMEAFAETWQSTAPGAVLAWRNAWEDFIPFLAFTPEIRKSFTPEPDRIDQLPTEEDHQNQGLISLRRCRDQAGLPWDPEHRDHTPI